MADLDGPSREFWAEWAKAKYDEAKWAKAKFAEANLADQARLVGSSAPSQDAQVM